MWRMADSSVFETAQMCPQWSQRQYQKVLSALAPSRRRGVSAPHAQQSWSGIAVSWEGPEPPNYDEVKQEICKEPYSRLCAEQADVATAGTHVTRSVVTWAVRSGPRRGRWSLAARSSGPCRSPSTDTTMHPSGSVSAGRYVRTTSRPQRMHWMGNVMGSSATGGSLRPTTRRAKDSDKTRTEQTARRAGHGRSASVATVRAIMSRAG